MTLADYMEKHKLSADAVALKLGVSQPYVSRLLTGRRRPSPETAKKLEKLTGIPAARFIFDNAAKRAEAAPARDAA
jgi:transcriptional regulator with XRE-family HTH domain